MTYTQQICVTQPFDINNDFKCNMKDIYTAILAYGSTPREPEWNPHADCRQPRDFKVNMADIFWLILNQGWS